MTRAVRGATLRRLVLLNAYCTHRSPPPLSFPHVLRNRRDRSDPELDSHLQGFMGFVMDRGRRRMNQTRYHVLCHLERVRHHLAIEVDGPHMDAFARWAREANAIVFLTDATVRAPNGAVLVAPDTGDAEPNAEMPYPADAMQRKQTTVGRLRSLGISVAETLPPVVAEVEVELRAPADVASRCLALFACALRAESLARREEIPTADLQRQMPLAFAAMSPKETAFVSTSAPSEQEIVDHTWRYEALAVLEWALAESKELHLPTRLCDVPALAQSMMALDAQKFVAAAHLRATSELLDALDLHYRLNWATTDARVNHGPPPREIQEGVVSERHHALNWLTRFRDADWDDVETPT